MEITKEGAQSLQMKMRNAELYLKEAKFLYGFDPLAARLPELATCIVSKLERLHCSPLFNSEHMSKLSNDFTRRVSNDMKLLRFTSLR